MLTSTARANNPVRLVPVAEDSIGDVARRAGVAQDYVGRMVEGLSLPIMAATSLMAM
jgi:hypothetical protein